jgi:hypothetical protein
VGGIVVAQRMVEQWQDRPDEVHVRQIEPAAGGEVVEPVGAGEPGQRDRPRRR